MKKVIETEVLAQLRRDVVDASVRWAYAACESFIVAVETDQFPLPSTEVSHQRILQAQKDFDKAYDAFMTVARENIATLSDEA